MKKNRIYFVFSSQKRLVPTEHRKPRRRTRTTTRKRRSRRKTATSQLSSPSTRPSSRRPRTSSGRCSTNENCCVDFGKILNVFDFFASWSENANRESASSSMRCIRSQSFNVFPSSTFWDESWIVCKRLTLMRSSPNRLVLKTFRTIWRTSSSQWTSKRWEKS